MTFKAKKISRKGTVETLNLMLEINYLYLDDLSLLLTCTMLGPLTLNLLLVKKRFMGIRARNLF